MSHYGIWLLANAHLIEGSDRVPRASLLLIILLGIVVDIIVLIFAVIVEPPASACLTTI